MSAARYWRIVGCEARGRGLLQLSEVHLYNAAGARVEASATITSSIAPVAGSLVSLNDNDLSTTVDFAAAAVRAPGFWIAWDFGTEIAISAVRFGAGSDLATFLGPVTLQRLSAGGWVTVASARQITHPGANAVGALNSVGAPPAILLAGDGAEGGTSIVDSGPSALSVSVSGTVLTSANPAKFSEAMRFNGVGHVSAQSSAFAFGSADFTVEYWQWATSATGDPGAFQLSDSPGGLKPSAASIAVLWGGANWFVYCGTSYNTGVAHTGVNNWAHVALVRASGVLSLFINGVRIWTASNNYNAVGQHLAVGAYYGTSFRFPGSVDDFAVTPGVAKYLENFALPAESLGGSRMLHADGGVMPTARPVTSALTIDPEDGGRNWITGTTRNTGTPETPVRRRVRLHDQRSGRLLRETWSNAATGAYVFPHLRAGTYYITAFDHTGLYGGVIETDVQSEPMP